MGREERRGLVVAVELDLDNQKAKHNDAKRPRPSIPSNTEKKTALYVYIVCLEEEDSNP